MNLYLGKTMAERKAIDRDLRERAKPKMFYQTSEIRYWPNLLIPGSMEPYANPLWKKPYRRAS